MQQMKKPDMNTGKVAWQCPSNIALVKYWGKKPVQIPANPSLSMTLSRAYTEMSVEYGPSPELSVEFLFEGNPRPDFERKITNYLAAQSGNLPFIKHTRFRISSRNTFPHSAGIASSASSMGALGLCLATIEADRAGSADAAGMMQRASELARLASGSACRSVYGGYTVWGRHEAIGASTDQYAVPVPFTIHPEFRDMGDAILVVSGKEKSVSSRAGHALMDGHPYAEARYRRAHEHIGRLARALETGDLEEFVRITELEAMDLHSLMMSSPDSFLLIEPATVSIIHAVRRFRKETGIPACFTLDAGPNVHLIYPMNHRDKVHSWIGAELSGFTESGRVIDDSIGQGPVRLE